MIYPVSRYCLGCEPGYSVNYGRLDMKTSEATIIMVPGYTNSGENHWQSRWQRNIKTARRVEQDDWLKPEVESWTENFLKTLRKSGNKPIIIIAHSLGCHLTVQGAMQFDDLLRKKVRGALLVAPPDVENPNIKPKHLMTFGPYPRDPMPFPSIVIASSNDRFCDYSIADEMAASWGSMLIDAGDQGHINAESGHGPWPEGLMVFSKFLSQIKN